MLNIDIQINKMDNGLRNKGPSCNPTVELIAADQIAGLIDQIQMATGSTIVPNEHNLAPADAISGHWVTIQRFTLVLNRIIVKCLMTIQLVPPFLSANGPPSIFYFIIWSTI